MFSHVTWYIPSGKIARHVWIWYVFNFIYNCSMKKHKMIYLSLRIKSKATQKTLDFLPVPPRRTAGN